MRKRDLLETELAQAGRSLLPAVSGEAVVELGRRVLQLDSCCQDAYLATMRALRELRRPQEAVRLDDACRRRLALELSMEPSIEIIREHELAQLNLSQVRRPYTPSSNSCSERRSLAISS